MIKYEDEILLQIKTHGCMKHSELALGVMANTNIQKFSQGEYISALDRLQVAHILRTIVCTPPNHPTIILYFLSGTTFTVSS